MTTGVGASVGTQVPEARAPARWRSTCCASTAAAPAGCSTTRRRRPWWWRGSSRSRAATRACGPSLLERLCALLERRILPCIPEEGSVGASGDLTPLSYLAALLVGEREALVSGQVVPAGEALAAAGLEPLVLEPKESLALMNGTSVMTALACLAFERATRVARLAAAVTRAREPRRRGQPGALRRRRSSS